VTPVVQQRYAMQQVAATEKLALMCMLAIQRTEIAKVTRAGNYIYRVSLEHLPVDIDVCRGRYGIILEYQAADPDCIGSIANLKYQTVTYFGFTAKQLAGIIIQQRLSGVDRVVPVGDALGMDVVWDGYDVISHLTRVVSVL